MVRPPELTRSAGDRGAFCGAGHRLVGCTPLGRMADAWLWTFRRRPASVLRAPAGSADQVTRYYQRGTAHGPRRRSPPRTASAKLPDILVDLVLGERSGRGRGGWPPPLSYRAPPGPGDISKADLPGYPLCAGSFAVAAAHDGVEGWYPLVMPMTHERALIGGHVPLRQLEEARRGHRGTRRPRRTGRTRPARHRVRRGARRGER